MRARAAQGSVGIEWEENTVAEYEQLSASSVDGLPNLPSDRLIVAKHIRPGTPAAAAPGLAQVRETPCWARSWANFCYKRTKLAQELGQLQPFIAVSP